jgi:hypothetical protein
MSVSRALAAVALATAALATAAAPALAHHPHRSDLAAAYAGTARYHSLDRAQADGYSLLTDAQGIECIDQPAEGGMGVHYVSGALVGDAKVDAATPEALVYEPRRHGRPRLVAAEYVVFQAAWDAEHPRPPRLFGQEFELLDSGNRYGLPPFYELHAWLWMLNPRGFFDDWNPRVHCL